MLISKRPELAKEWHPTKNGNVRPDTVPAGSHRKVWWICAKGHEWQAVISSRVSGNGCPFCSNKRVLAGFNDLATTNPESLSEWCYELNTDVTPQDVTVRSGKVVWWQCPKGHQYKTRVADHSASRGCPYCANKRVLPGFNDLSTTRPELASEWHPIKNGDVTPSEVIAGSHKKYWWACPLGHEWQATPQDRSYGAGCHVCANERQTSFPEQAVLWYLAKLTRAVSRAKVNGDECDIYLPDLEAGVEYDGYYYHNRSKERDEAKKARLGKSLSKLVTILEVKDDDNVRSDSLTIAYTPDKNYHNLEGVIRAVISLLGLESAIEINIEADRSSIYQAYVQSVKDHSLAVEHPELAREWHAEKNGLLGPTQVFSGSNKRVWWICSKGHAYQASISNRVAGKGCPYCSGQKVLAGYNDLMTVEPEIVREWATELNGEVRADGVTAHSTKRVWWRCERGHAWESTVSNRVEGYGCPYCSNQKVLAGYNDLATTNPELAAEWHPTRNGEITPSGVIAGTHKKFWWICERGHEWEATLSGRNAGHGCPYCVSIWVLPGFNDLATVNPNVAKEWHPTRNGDVTPSAIAPKSNKKMWWLCSLGHEWQASVADRTGGKSCPYCSNRLVLHGFNDLATTNPFLAAEWHPAKNGGLKPWEVMAGSSRKVWWRCELGHEWEARISHRNAGSGCPVCTGQKALSGFNDLQTVNPDLASEWNYEKNTPLEPTDVRPNSNKKVWWRCEIGHEWDATVGSRNRGNGCPYCSGRKPIPGVNDLATTNPDIASEWDSEGNGDLTPTGVTAKSRKKVWWICIRGHRWPATVSSRAGGRSSGCPYCLEEGKSES